jgi:hypothetical protein
VHGGGRDDRQIAGAGCDRLGPAVIARRPQADVAIRDRTAPDDSWTASPQPVRKDGRLPTPYGSR